MKNLNILINCPLNFDIKTMDSKLGGIEILNISLAKMLNKKGFNITISSNCKRKNKMGNITNLPIKTIIKKNKYYRFDTIISSNDATIFKYFGESKKILWLHNKLQIEKSLRKKQFLSIIKHKPISIFVSNYLKKKTSILYPFKKRLIINNFLTDHFYSKKTILKRKPIFIWSVQRTKGLDKTINIWINEVFPNLKNAKFYIFGVKTIPKNYKQNFLKSKNIFFKGKVNRNILRKYYSNSMGMICLGYDETFCLNALEANSMGLPIISFGYSALNEIIKNNYNGFIIKDYNQLSNKIISIINFNNSYRNKIINNSLLASKKFDRYIIIKKWLKII
tara:strand:+ start:184 stop:1188 length:1005 start_codon:yes stop_codon:yes gene_type:complete